MYLRRILSLSAIAALSLAVLPSGAVAQQKSLKEQLVGAWTLVSVINEQSDGTKIEGFGPSPKGIIIFTRDGYFSLLQTRADLPKVAANDRAKATPEEATAIAKGSIAYYGTYVANDADKIVAVKIETSTFPNLIGTDQKRIVTSITPDELKFTNPRTPSGAILYTVWKRAPAP